MKRETSMSINSLPEEIRKRAIKIRDSVEANREDIEDAYGEPIERVRLRPDGTVTVRFESGIEDRARIVGNVYLMVGNTSEDRVNG